MRKLIIKKNVKNKNSFREKKKKNKKNDKLLTEKQNARLSISIIARYLYYNNAFHNFECVTLDLYDSRKILQYSKNFRNRKIVQS